MFPFLCPVFSELRGGGINGAEYEYIYHSSYTPINTHRKWQLRGSGAVTRDGDVGRGLTPICCCVCTGKHCLFWLERYLHGDSLGIMTTRCRCSIQRFFSRCRVPTVCKHINTKTDALTWSGGSASLEPRQASTNTHTHPGARPNERQHKRRVERACVTLVLQLSFLRGTVPSITP